MGLSTYYQRNGHSLLVAVYGGLMAFFTYSCMYGFRKGFAIGNFSEYDIQGISAKVIYVFSQLAGYTLSKFYGIRFVSSLSSQYRVQSIIGLNILAWLALFLFAIVPTPWKPLFMFLNGIPLGLIWGLVFSYLEGRRTTELMGAFLCVSFIFSSGLVKTVSAWAQSFFELKDIWVPFVTGALFLLPLIIFTILLSKLPSPSATDELQRVKRAPMSAEQRAAFWKKYMPGLVLLLVVYVGLTILRDFRDNFMADILREKQVLFSPKLFTQMEIPTSLLILLLVGGTFKIKNNKSAFNLSLSIIIIGLMVSGVTTFMFYHQSISVVNWITFTGLGLYMGYIPFNTIVYERLISMLKEPVNIGFLMYIADSAGYLGSMAVLLMKELALFSTNWTSFYFIAVNFTVLSGILFVIISLIYFNKRKKA